MPTIYTNKTTGKRRKNDFLFYWTAYNAPTVIEWGFSYRGKVGNSMQLSLFGQGVYNVSGG